MNTHTLHETIRTNLENILMKTIITLVLCFGAAILFTTEPLFARQSDRQMVPLNEKDYECFQQLSCVAESEELRSKGWVVTLDETIINYPLERTARMTGEGIALIARYDKNGNLLRGTYERQNVALPKDLLNHLAGEDFSGWAMTANNMTIRDFDVTSTVYHIILENETGKKTVRFTHSDVMDMKARTTQQFTDNY
jgi:hypothetical protein